MPVVHTGIRNFGMLAHALESIHRREGGRILAALIRQFGNFDLAAEALQDAYAKAQAALALRTLCGLSTREAARAAVMIYN